MFVFNMCTQEKFMKVDRSNNVQNQNFGKFIKIKAPSHKIDKFRTALIENGDKFLT